MRSDDLLSDDDLMRRGERPKHLHDRRVERGAIELHATPPSRLPIEPHIGPRGLIGIDRSDAAGETVRIGGNGGEEAVRTFGTVQSCSR